MDKKQETGSGRALGEIAAITAAVSASALSMWGSIRHGFYQALKSMGVYEEIYAQRIAKQKELAEAHKALGTAATSEVTAQFKQRLSRASKQYSQQVNEINQQMGFSNHLDKFGFLSKAEKAKVIGIGLTVASVALGAYFSIRHKKDISDKIEGMKRNKEPELARQ